MTGTVGGVVSGTFADLDIRLLFSVCQSLLYPKLHPTKKPYQMIAFMIAYPGVSFQLSQGLINPFPSFK